jgi:hypothetical protein
MDEGSGEGCCALTKDRDSLFAAVKDIRGKENSNALEWVFGAFW